MGFVGLVELLLPEDTCRILASDNLTQLRDWNTSSSYCLKKLTKFSYHDNLTSTYVIKFAACGSNR